ncbi:MAG: hypothetical protein JWQ96_2649 [Segetibacter sp.]|nr:hypothetical protein [Segetibacter sp.]
MNINRHNYEEFFLLYIDNELNDEQRKAVEIFAAQHPDLKEELDILQEAVLPAEAPVTFSKKEELYKKESGINLSNFNEYFLLFADDELNAQDKEAVERFVLKNPQLQDEFTLLKQTRLPLEVIECSFKESLYKEEKVRRIIPLYFARIAVAAAFIGLAIGLWVFLPGTTTTGKSGVVANETGDTKLPAIKKDATADVEKPVESETIDKRANTSIAATKNATRPSPTQDRPEAKQPVVAKNATVEKPAQQQQEDNLANVSTPGDKEDKPRAPIEVIDRAVTGLTNDNLTSTSNTKRIAKPIESLFRHASNKQEYEEEEEDDNVLLIAGGEFNKKKVLGLLKKATNLFDKKQNKGESERKIQIANFEIKTK